MKNRDLNLARLRHRMEFIDGKAKITPILEPAAVENSKARKKYKIRTATIELNGNVFDADEGSINFMSSILALANFKVNEAVRGGVAFNDAYDAVYNKTIQWKDNDNNWRDIKIGDIGIGLEAAMYNIATLVD